MTLSILVLVMVQLILYLFLYMKKKIIIDMNIINSPHVNSAAQLSPSVWNLFPKMFKCWYICPVISVWRFWLTNIAIIFIIYEWWSFAHKRHLWRKPSKTHFFIFFNKVILHYKMNSIQFIFTYQQFTKSNGFLFLKY